jgi:tRNA threonylcarbamoyladenosine biosynthesis protein TsaE
MEQRPPVSLADLEELHREAARFARSLVPNASRATLVALSGELGAGKTSFVQGVAETLGVTEPITSPTFVLEKVYELPDGAAFTRLVHIDAYRLEGERSLAPLGFAELAADPGNLILLEWPELVASQLPNADHHLTLTVAGNGRELIYG